MGCCYSDQNKLSDETKSLMIPNQSVSDTFQTVSSSPNDAADGDQYKKLNGETKDNESAPKDHKPDVNDTDPLPIIAETTTDPNYPTLSYTNPAMRIQIEQLPSFGKDQPWILDKDRKKESPASSTSMVKAFSYDKETLSRRRVTLTNTHNFVWFISIVQGAVKSAEVESEITRGALDKVLHLSPVPWRDKIWEICNIECDTFIVNEEFEEFVDALLLATGQFEMNMASDYEMFEVRDMSKPFRKMVRVSSVFSEEKCVVKNKSLSTFGAGKVIMTLRNLKNEKEIPPSDIAIPLLTGFTKKSIRHSVKYCTKIWWKILTDRWWQEEEDTGLSLNNNKSHSRSKKTQVSQDVKRHLAQLSMDDLFGSDSDDDEEDESDHENDSNYLNV